MLIWMMVPLDIGDKFSTILSINDDIGVVLIIQVSIAVLILSLYFFLWLKERS